MKEYIFYHDPCLDGFSSAFLIWLYEGQPSKEKMVFRGLSYTKKQNRKLNLDFDLYQKENAKIVFVDFVPNLEDLVEIHERQIPHFIIDHHNTAIDDIDRLEKESGIFLNTYLSRDNSLSGCGLVRQWYQGILIDNKPETYLKHLNADIAWEFCKFIQDRDLWTHKLADTNMITETLWSLDFDFNLWKELTLKSLESDGKALLRLKHKMLDFISASSFELVVGPHTALCVNSNVYQSDLGNKFLKENDNIDFALVYSEDRDRGVRCSLRSRADFDCSKIAKFFDGGGHKQACGFKINDLNKIKEYKDV